MKNEASSHLLCSSLLAMVSLSQSFKLLLWSQLLVAFVMSFQKAGRLARLARAAVVASDRRSAASFVPRSQWLTPSLLFGAANVEQEKDPGVVEGTDLRIVKYPHPALRNDNQEVTPEELKDGSIAKLAKEMLLIMYAAEGVGLAAPQVGVNKRLMVYNESGDKKKWLDEVILVNPRITEFSDGKVTAEEACLSFPDMSGDVERSRWIKVEALNLKGKKVKRKYTEWEARIFQHEYDHLDGIVYVDRLDEEGRTKVQPRLDDLAQEFGEGGAL